jgi:hypothetical protein
MGAWEGCRSGLEHREQPERQRREETNQCRNRLNILRLPLMTGGVS